MPSRNGGFVTGRHVPTLAPSSPLGATILAGSTTPTERFAIADLPPDVSAGSVTAYYYVLTETSTGAQETRVATTSSATLTGLSGTADYDAGQVSFGTSFGDSQVSSNVTVLPAGQAEYTTPGTYSWVAPAGVTSVSVVCVGGGGGPASSTSSAGGAGGGGLGWKNEIAVTPGASYTVVVGAGGTGVTTGTAPSGGDSYFINDTTVKGGGGGGARAANTGSGARGTFVGDGGGQGGLGGSRGASTTSGAGGGGAGGYSGNGGSGANSATASGTIAGSGFGGAGGGGGSSGSSDTAGSGGGVGIYGQGASGSGGAASANDGAGGFGGSGGGDANEASLTAPGSVYSSANRSTPGNFGGGGAGSDIGSLNELSNGGGGAVRIIWPSPIRRFPSTLTGDL